MWICPKCHQSFVNSNQSHSCGKYTVDRFLKGKSREGVALFRYLLAEYRKIGRFTLHPVKTRVALLTQMRFCAINKIGPDFIDIHLVLTEPHTEVQSFRRIENLGNRFYIHHLRIRQQSDISSAVRDCMKLAYRIGNREHVRVKQQGR